MGCGAWVKGGLGWGSPAWLPSRQSLECSMPAQKSPASDTMRVFISYKRGVRPDEPLALALFEQT